MYWCRHCSALAVLVADAEVILHWDAANKRFRPYKPREITQQVRRATDALATSPPQIKGVTG
jgi:hypothetical protein